MQVNVKSRLAGLSSEPVLRSMLRQERSRHGAEGLGHILCVPREELAVLYALHILHSIDHLYPLALSAFLHLPPHGIGKVPLLGSERVRLVNRAAHAV